MILDTRGLSPVCAQTDDEIALTWSPVLLSLPDGNADREDMFFLSLSLSESHSVSAWTVFTGSTNRTFRRYEPPSKINQPFLPPAEPRLTGDLCLSWQQGISGAGSCPQTSCMVQPSTSLNKKPKHNTDDRRCGGCNTMLTQPPHPPSSE